MLDNDKVAEMAKFPIHSDEWFKAAFEGVNAISGIRIASEHICKTYGIKGQSDPGYIANVIQYELDNMDNQR